MDIFVQRVPEAATSKQLRTHFDDILHQYGIIVYHIEKHLNRPTVVITVLDKAAGQRFLVDYGVPPGAHPRYRPPKGYRLGQNWLRFNKSRNEPSDFSIQSLAYEATQRAKNVATKAPAGTRNTNLTRFQIGSLNCGIWEYATDSRQSAKLAFLSQFEDNRSGEIHLGRRSAMIILGPLGSDQCRIDIDYHDCYDINIGTYEEPSVTFNLDVAPKMYTIRADDVVSAQLATLLLGRAKAQAPKKIRLPAINSAHEDVAAACRVYRVTLTDWKMLANIRTLLNQNASKKCSVLSYKTTFQYPGHEHVFKNALRLLETELTDQSQRRTGSRPWSLRFQVLRLAMNGLLPPQTVSKLIPKCKALHDKYGLDATLFALVRFARDLSSIRPGPSTEAVEFSLGTLEQILETHAISYDPYAVENPFELVKRHNHIILVHKIVFTPTGTFLEGPEPEPANRVLRRYPGKTDHFARVLFQDEEGGTVRYDPRTDLSKIYHERFKKVLDGTTIICGRAFSFLGFSHSSLRSQSCWFMATLVNNQGRLLFTEHVIRELGEFSHIRIPAKCAARIGQNFTDTNTSVAMKPHEVGELPNVVRNGRDFSDGVGTISEELLQSVWRVYGTRKLLKPTVLQIRFQGAKGMLSLDERLAGKRLMLRQNMRKYETKATWDLEICGAAFRPLPMILNRQFIKIFEDLLIPKEVFLDLQQAAMKRLRLMTASSVNTATLLEETEGTRAARTPSLIRHLGQIGLDYHQDPFLYSVVEMAVVSSVRDIKYRGRIPVEDGLTLYGIMDETGYLKEGEIYVVTENAAEFGGKRVLVHDRVIITRSPALHPGDIQLANAVDVPESSPLKRLSNVVVFSQHGQRDLPSQLAGGDVDGDLYNIIWHKPMIPSFTWPAADYPKVEAEPLDRDVTRKDMSDFFVTFMESDQLGMICNNHLQLADQRDHGTFDAACLDLAQRASVAVDFSKTGIPVDIAKAPRPDRCRPDFMAPSPRVVVSERGSIDLEEDDYDDDDAFEGLDSERRPHRYYESKKTLGHLYRAIDERQFLADMQQEHNRLTRHARERSASGSPLLEQVLQYVKQWAETWGVVEYTQHLPLAEQIKAGYEESLADILYDYEPSPRSPLSESEVFAGQILGRQSGPQGKPLRELSKRMRDRFEVVVDYAAMRMTKGDQVMQEAADLDDLYDDTLYSDREFEALPRAIASLQVALTAQGYYDRKLGELKSFRYIAAAVCLRELERYRTTTFGRSVLPPFER